MTTLSDLIYTMLSDATITALVSARIYPNLLPQTPTLPAIVYTRISGPPRSGSTTFRQSRYQVDCWAASADASSTLAATVIAACEDYTDGGQSPAIAGVYSANQLEDYDENTRTYRTIVDFIVSSTGD